MNYYNTAKENNNSTCLTGQEKYMGDNAGDKDC